MKTIPSVRAVQAPLPVLPSAPRTSVSRRPAWSLPVKTILVPMDFSAHSTKALHYAQAIGEHFGAELLLVHVMEQVVYPGDWLVPVLAASDFVQECREKLTAKMKRHTEGMKAKTRYVVRTGRAWQEIIEIARQNAVELIVIGTHGYTGLRHILLGSVAEKVVQHAPCPVLTVRPDEREFK